VDSSSVDDSTMNLEINTVKSDDPSYETIVNNETVEESNKLNITPENKTYLLEVKEINHDSTNNQENDNNINSNENIEITLEGYLGNISKQSNITLKTSNNEQNKTTIIQITFTPSSNQTNVKLIVSDLKEKPAEIKNEMILSKSKKLYKYLDVKLLADETYIGESGISSMDFIFTVEKKWITDQNLDKFSITMMRYHNDTWQKLNTYYLNETETIIYYKTETPGLSVFAVVGGNIVEGSDAIINESIQIPWWFSFGIIASSSTILGVVIIKKRFIYRT
jgi:PGF-pre-PGF domain-containing protein